MGVYAESEIQIECGTKESAQAVWKALIESQKDKPEFEIEGVSVEEFSVWGKMSSGRVQNLRYQCEKLWEFIKDIEGVINCYCPFMVEEQGESFSNETE